MRLVELGFKTIYMDSDNLVLRPDNFLDPFSEPCDIQGLSDWGEAELWPVGSVDKTCGLYYQVADSNVPRKAMLREWWHVHQGLEKLDVANPCQSTGLWYLQPTNRTVAFMRSMVYRIGYQAVWQWDQTAWNERKFIFKGEIHKIWGILN